MDKNEFKCDNCGGIFELNPNEKEVVQECIKNFGRPPLPTDALTCDDCYEKILKWIKVKEN